MSTDDLDQRWDAFLKGVRERDEAHKKSHGETPERLMPLDERKQWYALKEELGKRIDPETCTVFFQYTDVSDPFYIEPPENRTECVGRTFFAMNPGNKNPVDFAGIPDEIISKIWKKREAADDEGWRVIYEQLHRSRMAKVDAMTEEDFGPPPPPPAPPAPPPPLTEQQQRELTKQRIIENGSAMIEREKIMRDSFAPDDRLWKYYDERIKEIERNIKKYTEDWP